MTKVGVIGAAGKMGTLACQTIEAAGDLSLGPQITEDNSIDELTGADVAIDFTHPGVVMDNVRWCVEHGVDVVVGTSGFTDERLQTVQGWLGESPQVGVLVIPNFSIGAVLMMRFAAEAAKYFESAEIIELHHPTKLDAPSGTSLRTAQLMAQARADAGARATTCGSAAKRSSTGAGSLAAQTTARSSHASRQRRASPAGSPPRAAATPSREGRVGRSPGAPRAGARRRPSRASASRRRASVFGPTPGTSRSRPAAAASRSSCGVLSPSARAISTDRRAVSPR